MGIFGIWPLPSRFLLENGWIWTGTDFCYFFVSGAECNTFFVRLYFFFNLNYNWHIVDHLSVHSFLLCRGIQNAFSLTVAQKFVKASISHLKDYLEFKTTIFYVSHHQKIRQMKVFLQSFQKNSWNQSFFTFLLCFLFFSIFYRKICVLKIYQFILLRYSYVSGIWMFLWFAWCTNFQKIKVCLLY